MDYGNKPSDGGHLILSSDDRDNLLEEDVRSQNFIRPYMGSQEVIRGIERFCLWIKEDELQEAASIPSIARRIDSVRDFRLASTKESTRKMADRPFEFDQVRIDPVSHCILVPRVSSERRPYLPVARFSQEVISSDSNQVLHGAPDWCIGVIGSRLHLVWIASVCGKLKSDFRYSVALGWNTFPVPNFTEDQLAALTKSAMAILRCRLMHHPKTIAELYDPDKMPDDLRAAHKANDDLLESMYVGRPFRNDTERLEHLFKLYAARIKKLKKGGT
jgi:hypothetical protein